MTEENAAERHNDQTRGSDDIPIQENLRLAALRPHLGYIAANIAGAGLLILTAIASAFGTMLTQRYNIPPYVPSMALLIEIGLLLMLAYAQQTFSKRFRVAILVSGIITLAEAGILFYYANPNL